MEEGQEVEAASEATAVETDTSGSDSGSFLPEHPARADSVETGAPSTPGKEADPASNVVFNLGEKAYKPDYKLTPEDIKLLHEEVSRGTLRFKDYTEKTQKLTQERKNLDAWRNALYQDPKFFLQNFPMEFLQKIMGQAQPAKSAQQEVDDLADFEPASANIIRGQRKEISDLKDSIKKIEQHFQTQMETEKERTISEAKTQIQSEVKDALTKYPNVTEKILLQAIYSDPNSTTEVLAKEINDFYENKWNERVTNQAKKPGTKVVGGGESVPSMPKRPKTMEDAARAAASRLGIPNEE